MTTAKQNQFETLAHHKLIANTKNVWNKVFAGVILRKNIEVEAKSAKLNGLPEFGIVLNYTKTGKTVMVEIEFCGDNGCCVEMVNVKDCKNIPILFQMSKF